MGSGSPRRLELLGVLGIQPDAIRPPDIDETPIKGERPRPYCARMALEKAQAVQVDDPDDIVLSADTTVAVGRRILGKPADAEEARAFFALLSGRRHRVVTALAVKRGDKTWQRDVESAVRVKALSAEEIDAYIATEDWRGKAGGYAIQGPFAAFIPWVQGSHSAIVGLPLHETAMLLGAAGYPLWNTP
nr:Maf family protein [Mesobacterium pallidum]